ncbi:MAG: AAA family ATPase [Thermoplasmata archaeon]|nr:AAA family ATPase [Thermoplasmata archaeon]MCI4359180.1 AAA family ATPase [Thermoplasmata archaeon]
MSSILVAEETLDPNFVPPRLVRRDAELALIVGRYRSALSKGLTYHQFLTGGIGSGKTALARKVAQELARIGPLNRRPILTHYVNCWRRSNDRLVLLELLRAVGVYLPDKGYGVPDMLDTLEQGLRKTPAHRIVLLDEVGALVRQETRLIYLLTRSGEVGLGSISLLMVSPEDVLPYLDAASRSSFGSTHRLALPRYEAEDLVEILSYRAGLALRPGSYSPDVIEQIASLAAPTGDARFALELLQGAARYAEESGSAEVEPEHVRSSKGSMMPTLSEAKLEALGDADLLILLALSRSLRGPRTRTPTGRVRQSYASVAEEYGRAPVSRVTFWRAVRSLELEGVIQVEPSTPGRPSRLGMDEVPAGLLTTLIEERFSARRRRKS